jgi:hypothetical protein
MKKRALFLSPIFFIGLFGFMSLSLAQEKDENFQAQIQNQSQNQSQNQIQNQKGAVKKSRVFFIEPVDGATVKQKFKVKFGVEGMTVKPAGVIELGSGHHHLIINAQPFDEKQVIPANETNIHYGKGQTEAELSLKPGVYKLTLQFADGAHRSYGPMMSESISVTVK